MRILLPLSILVLVASAVWAPLEFRAREPQVDTSGLELGTARERAARAEKDRAIGPALHAYQDLRTEDPNDLEALRGLLRATLRLSASMPRQSDIGEALQRVATDYLAALPEVDPDGSLLQESLREWVDIRIHHDWYLARAAVAMWLASRNDPAGRDEILDLMRRGPFWRNYYSYCQRFYPGWSGVEGFVREHLASDDDDKRIYAAVTLLIYHRIWGVGDDLLKQHGRAIRDLLIKAKAELEPSQYDSQPGTPGGQTILGLALLRDRDSRRILASMRLLDHPYLARVLEIARFWAGIDPWEKADFDSRKYETWYPSDHEAYFLGVMIAYADVVRRARVETDPKKKEALDARAKKLAVLVETATFFRMTSVQILARRTRAAIFPDQSEAIHRELIDQGGIDSIFGAMALPLDERIRLLLPAVSAQSPDYAGLAVAGMLRMDAPMPIQMPVASK